MRLVLQLGVVCICVLATAAAWAADCATLYAVDGVAVATPVTAARATVEAAGAKLKEISKRDDRHPRWVAERRTGGELLIDADGRTDAATVLRVTRIVPDPKIDLAAEITSATERWGKPLTERLTPPWDKPGTLTEATIWVDAACGVRVTLLARKEQTARGIALRYLALRVEALDVLYREMQTLRDEADKRTGF